MMNEQTDQIASIKEYNLSDAISMIEACCVDLRNIEDGSNELKIKLIAAASGYSEQTVREQAVLTSLELMVSALERIKQLEQHTF